MSPRYCGEVRAHHFRHEGGNLKFALATCIALGYVSAGMAQAQERTFLTKSEVEKLAIGKKWTHMRTRDQRGIIWDIRSDGNLWGSGVSGPNRDQGTWAINEQGQLCVKWRGNSANRCVAVVKDGGKLLMVDSEDLQGVYGDLRVD